MGGLWQLGSLRFHHATCTSTSCVSFVSAASFGCSGLTQPYSVLRHHQPLYHLTAWTAVIDFLFYFISFLLHSFSTKVALGSRWPPTQGQRHCAWHRPCQDTMRAHGHAGKCTINIDKHGHLMSLARPHYAAASWLLSAWKHSAATGPR